MSDASIKARGADGAWRGNPLADVQVYPIPPGCAPAVLGRRGVLDGALQLLVQGEISRGKAREMISSIVERRGDIKGCVALLDAPWDKLDWGYPL